MFAIYLYNQKYSPQKLCGSKHLFMRIFIFFPFNMLNVPFYFWWQIQSSWAERITVILKFPRNFKSNNPFFRDIFFFFPLSAALCQSSAILFKIEYLKGVLDSIQVTYLAGSQFPLSFLFFFFLLKNVFHFGRGFWSIIMLEYSFSVKLLEVLSVSF